MFEITFAVFETYFIYRQERHTRSVVGAVFSVGNLFGLSPFNPPLIPGLSQGKDSKIQDLQRQLFEKRNSIDIKLGQNIRVSCFCYHGPTLSCLLSNSTYVKVVGDLGKFRMCCSG